MQTWQAFICLCRERLLLDVREADVVRSFNFSVLLVDFLVIYLCWQIKQEKPEQTSKCAILYFAFQNLQYGRDVWVEG